ncbi:MAG: ABC transporter permease [Armatimonadetes bacterium]|nr:ABC transporter permease [Armatimonadota bacterium]
MGVARVPATAGRVGGRASLWRRYARSGAGVAAVAFLALLVCAALAGPLVYPRSPVEINLAQAQRPPGRDFPLGTDENGRDVLARALQGARTTLLVGTAAMAVAVGFGTLVGLVAGFYGGRVDEALMRATDIIMAVPSFFLALTILTLFGTSVPNIVLVIGMTSWMNVARLVRGEVLRVRGLEFVEAARASGGSDARILLSHVLPQTTSAITVASTIGVAWAILVESALSYLGLGVQPPTSTWGNMLTNSQNYFNTAPWLVMVPGFLISLTVLSANLAGDALRDALDPRSARRIGEMTNVG